MRSLMRITAFFVILLLAFQCLPHSLRLQTIATCMEVKNSDYKKGPIPNPATVLEDEIPHFTLHLQQPSLPVGALLQLPAGPNKWADAGSRIPNNRAHDIETPPPNLA